LKKLGQKKFPSITPLFCEGILKKLYKPPPPPFQSNA